MNRKIVLSGNPTDVTLIQAKITVTNETTEETRDIQSIELTPQSDTIACYLSEKTVQISGYSFILSNPFSITMPTTITVEYQFTSGETRTKTVNCVAEDL